MLDDFGGQIVNVFELPRPHQKDPFEVARLEELRTKALKDALRGLKGGLSLAQHQSALVTILEAMLGLEITKEKRMRTGRFEIYKDKAKEWRWRLVAPNGRTVADSGEGYTRKSFVSVSIRRFKEWAAESPIVDKKPATRARKK